MKDNCQNSWVGGHYGWENWKYFFDLKNDLKSQKGKIFKLEDKIVKWWQKLFCLFVFLKQEYYFGFTIEESLENTTWLSPNLQ